MPTTTSTVPSDPMSYTMTRRGSVHIIWGAGEQFMVAYTNEGKALAALELLRTAGPTYSPEGDLVIP